MSFFSSVKNKLGQLITSAIPETVSTNEQLVTCLQNGAPFKCDPNFKTVYFPYNTHKVLPFIDYLKENTAITSLAIISREWKQRELKEFVTCLSTFNRGITKLEFVLFDFAPTVMEGFVEILKKNKLIKSIEIQHPTSTFELKLPSGTLTRALNLSLEGFKVFTDNMEHYNIEELIISKSRLNRQCCELLLNGLRSNRSIKKVTIDQEKYLQEEGFSDLCQIMAANRITEFSLTGFTETKSTLTLISLNEVIKANFCRKLRIDGARILNISLAMISEELQTNTSLTDLTLLNVDLDFKILGILIKNKQIRRLEVGHAGLTVDREQIASLNLGSNTTMTDLTLAPFTGIDKAALFSSLRTNQMIRRLKVGAEANLANYDQDLEKFLTTNHSVHDLNIVKSLDESTFRVIVRSLKVNKTIRKLWLQTPRIKGEDFKFGIYDDNEYKQVNNRSQFSKNQ